MLWLDLQMCTGWLQGFMCEIWKIKPVYV